MTAIMLENSTAPFFAIIEGLSYETVSATSKQFLKRNLHRDSNLECKFDYQFQIDTATAAAN